MFKLYIERLKEVIRGVKSVQVGGNLWEKERVFKKFKERQYGVWGKMRLEDKDELELVGFYIL